MITKFIISSNNNIAYLCSMKNIGDINKEIRDKAIENGLCEQWQQDWEEDWDQGKMADRFFKGIDFYLDKRFLSNDFIKENFDSGFLRENGIIVDDNYSLLNPRRAIVIGESESTIRINDVNSATIYAVDNSKIKAIARNKAFLLIHALDKTQIDAQAYDSATIVVLSHSEGNNIVSQGNVRVKKEYDYLR